MYKFRIFNLLLSSELYFPELLVDLANNKASLINVKYGSVSIEGLDFSEQRGVFFQKNKNSVWLNIDKIARFLISNGQEIIIDPIGDVDEETLRSFILTCCFKYLLIQRNILTLQGCVIQAGEGAVAFVAPSGFGKSVLSALFLKNKYKILSDEICAIDDNLDVLPAYPEITLWKSMAQQLNIDTSVLKVVRPGLNKFILPLGGAFQENKIPLKLIYFLDYHKKEQLNIRILSCHEKQDILKQNHGGIVRDIEMVKLTCPRWKYGGHELAALLSSEFHAINQDLKRRMSHHGT